MIGLLSLLSTIAYLWMCFIISRRSVVGAILTFFLVLPALYYLCTGWGEEEHDIRVPFFASVAAIALAVALLVKSPEFREELERNASREAAMQILPT
jgi:hypothetical protein